MEKIKNKIYSVITFIIPFLLVCTVGCIFSKKKSAVPSHAKEGSFTNSLGMVFNEIPAGTFMLGSKMDELERNEDEILHKVTLTKPFFMQTTEVTQRQWKAIMKHNPSNFKKCGNDCPVQNVSWNDIQTFINKLNKRGEGIYRLPTEAEWEYAARAGTTTPFNTGDCIYGDYENFSPDTENHGSLEDSLYYCTSGVWHGTPLPVASLKPNVWGLYDMHGNVSEWVYDWYGPYPSTHVFDPTGVVSGQAKVVRGGNLDDSAGQCRSAFRGRLYPEEKNSFVGFRLVREIDQ